MLQLLADENFNGDIVRGLLLRNPGLNLIRVQDVALNGSDDPAILTWAAAHERIVLTHDRATMPGFALAQVDSGVRMAGVFIMNDRLPTGRAIEEILFLNDCSDPADWIGQVIYLPLQ